MGSTPSSRGAGPGHPAPLPSAPAHPLGDPRDDVLEVGGRLAAAPADLMVATAFAFELDGQRHLAREMGLCDLAHTVSLIEAGVIPPLDGAALLRALLALQARGPALPLDPARGDLYTNREALLGADTRAVGWLGAGRARRESTTTAHHLAVRARLLSLCRALNRLGRALADAAERHAGSLIPDYTYLQAAQPTTLGHWLLSFTGPLRRDLERLRAHHERVDRSPAGCGSANGSRLPQGRARLAALLGFGGLVEHARDAMWQADLPIEGAAVVTAILVNLDRLAEDLMFATTVEVGFLELDDAHARASKIMPQKKNPYALSYVRALANRAIGLGAQLAAAGRTPSGQVDNRLAAYGEVPRALDEAAGAAELVGQVVEHLRFRPERAAACLEGGFILATDLAETLLAEAGVDFRAAHRIVGRLARTLAEEGRPPASLTPADITTASLAVLGRPIALGPRALAAALDPAAAVAARREVGGAAPSAVREMIAQLRAALDDSEAWRAARARHAASAEVALLARARELSSA